MTPHGKRKKLPRSQRVRAYLTKEEVLERFREYVNPDAQASDFGILIPHPLMSYPSMAHVSYTKARKQIAERLEEMAKSTDALAAAWTALNP